MKFTIEGPLKDNAYSLMRKAGYYFQDRNNKSELIFLRPLVSSGYPRFHLYLKIENDNLFFSLHLDQKKPSPLRFLTSTVFNTSSNRASYW